MNRLKIASLEVSGVCLGAMNFGTTTPEKDAFEILDAFVAAGGNFIDTSNNYAHWQGTGDEAKPCLADGWLHAATGTRWLSQQKWDLIATAAARD